MEIPLEDQFLLKLLFADVQFIIVANEDDANYMMRKLMETYEKSDLKVTTKHSTPMFREQIANKISIIE